MMILTKEGFIYKSAPNLVSRKDDKGNWYEIQEGYKPDGIPLMKVIMFSDGRNNPALEALKTTGLLLSLQ